MLSWVELSEVVLEVETQLNRRPLSYVEDDVQHPVLTPASFLFQRANRLPELEPWREENRDLRKRAKHLKSCKDALWKRWTREYLAALRERHGRGKEGKLKSLKIGDVVIIHSEEKNRGQWPLRIVEQLYGGRDGVIRAVKLRTGKSILERLIQHLYPLELSCDDPENVARPTQLDAQAPVPAQGEMRHSRLEFTFATCFKMKSYDSHHTHIDYGKTTKKLSDREHLALLSWYFFFSFFFVLA
ncbi:uncharacterized protein LOC122957901 [Acropora millepora]|uniref:uncharacterized protein LOC122957901 n=1 Tax=Acropora millepora TaxID=45264 RepID=UPI001CF2502F|nr:uncharacterized protein LOC122957901 [Acropora millepora]